LHRVKSEAGERLGGAGSIGFVAAVKGCDQVGARDKQRGGERGLPAQERLDAEEVDAVKEGHRPMADAGDTVAVNLTV